VQKSDSTPLTAAVGLAAVGLAGSLLGYLPWPIGVLLFLAGGGAAVWLRKRVAPAAAPRVVQKVESGLRIVEKPLAGNKKGLTHALRVTISTEVAVELGLRVTCDGPINEVEPVAQTGRGAGARQGVPAFVRESRQSCLFVMRNSPGERELFLRVDLFAAQPIHIQRVEQIRPGGKVTLPEWKELDLVLAAPEAPAGAEAAPAAAAAAPGAATEMDAPAAPVAPDTVPGASAAPAASSPAAAPAAPATPAAPGNPAASGQPGSPG
jgi:hypothetical protein